MVILQHTFTDSLIHFHTRFTQFSRYFHAILVFLTNFGPISMCWVPKSMFSSWGIQWWYFLTLLHTPSHIFICFSRNVHTICAILANFGPISTFWVSKCMSSSSVKSRILPERDDLIPQLEYILLGTQHVEIGPKLAKIGKIAWKLRENCVKNVWKCMRESVKVCESITIEFPSLSTYF